MNTDEIRKKLKEVFSKGAKVSKDAFDKAGDKVQYFTYKSVVKLEKRQLENKRDCKYEELGLKISQMLMEGASVSSSNMKKIQLLNSIQQEIKLLSDQIREKESLC